MARHRESSGLGLGQLFVLIFGFLISSALIFVFGIWVGRDVAERRLAQEERVVRMPIPAAPTPQEDAKDAVDLSFYEKIKEKAYQRLQQTASPATPARVAQVPTPTSAPTRAAAKPTSRLPTPALGALRAEPTARAEDWADAGWTVQVNATTNPQQAADLAAVLRTKGYDAYTVQAPMRGQTWYRVRVGRFSSRDKAKELETQLKNNAGMENAYATPR